ncbi:MAG: hypothetical protein EA369_06140 [Bradymonadales bacterium]|nr:MAG: hypothetical protein EA369_06140 [Bradymonadales bacterium]
MWGSRTRLVFLIGIIGLWFTDAGAIGRPLFGCADQILLAGERLESLASLRKADNFGDLSHEQRADVFFAMEGLERELVEFLKERVPEAALEAFFGRINAQKTRQTGLILKSWDDFFKEDESFNRTASYWLFLYLDSLGPLGWQDWGLSEADEGLLQEKMKGRLEIRNLLVEKNLSLVKMIARQFLVSKNLPEKGYYFDELVGLGNILLVKVVETFQPSRKLQLSTPLTRVLNREYADWLNEDARRRKLVGAFGAGGELSLPSGGKDPSARVEDEDSLRALKRAVPRLKDERHRTILVLYHGLEGGPGLTFKQIGQHEDFLRVNGGHSLTKERVRILYEEARLHLTALISADSR